jgi:hypothetical protein
MSLATQGKDEDTLGGLLLYHRIMIENEKFKES